MALLQTSQKRLGGMTRKLRKEKSQSGYYSTGILPEKKTIQPQHGFQLRAQATSADIAILGGAAGLGKTFVLLLEFLRHIHNPEWGAVGFRRTSPQIRNEGGLWDTSMQIYPHAGGAPKESTLEWIFPKGAKLKFSHLEYDKNILDWQGSQIPFIFFDELTHFTEKMFFYLLTRNRSTCGVAPYVRATCNPDPDSWVAKLISWWIDQNTGFPIAERDGVLRYFTRDGENYIWGDTAQEVIDKSWYFLEKIVAASKIDPKVFVKSLTFISGTIYDNKELLTTNPQYLANLLAQDEATKAALFAGNWKVVLSENDIYPYPAFIGMFENLFKVKTEGRYITADIALKGSDKFIVGVWYGFELADILIMPKSDGAQVINGIVEMAKKHNVQNRHTVYDNDGVGGFIDGFIIGAKGFVNGAKALNDENYYNLKTQCFYKSGDRAAKGEYRVSEKVANTMYDDKMTVRQRFIHERKAIKRDKADADGKLRIIPKEQMKVFLSGQSPDLMDMWMMREYFEVKKEPSEPMEQTPGGQQKSDFERIKRMYGM